ncbi:MAG TPA: ABC transporter substrate-binding protein [Solirubrobacteraceae bacterium]|nr:ABC transporter substrate-binding protein [Solirubrobacteraceae bacterium]
MSIRKIRLAGALLLCTLFVTACGSSGSSSGHGSGSGGTAATAATVASGGWQNLSDVTLHIGDQAGTGAEAVLSAAGLLNKLPFKVVWSDFTSGPPMMQAMSAGALDVGGVGDAPPVFAAAGGAKIAIVAAIHNDPNSAALVVPKNSPITSISQLKGKKIAVAQGSSADYHLLTVLTKAGLTVHDVSLEYLQPAEGLAALNSGSVAAWDIWSPFIEQARVEHGARILVNGNGYGSNFSYVVASREALGNGAKAAAIRDYIKTLAQAHAWVNAHPQAWAAQWAKATGLPLNVMVGAANDDTQSFAPITPQIVANEQGLVNAFSAAGLIPSKYDFSQYSYSGFNSVL